MDFFRTAYNWVADIVYRDRSDAWKAAVSTTIAVFVTAMLGATLNLWDAIQSWIAGEDESLVDDFAVWTQAAMSAATAFVVGLVNYVFRWAQSKFNVIPGEGPHYTGKS